MGLPAIHLIDRHHAGIEYPVGPFPQLVFGVLQLPPDHPFQDFLYRRRRQGIGPTMRFIRKSLERRETDAGDGKDDPL